MTSHDLTVDPYPRRPPEPGRVSEAVAVVEVLFHSDLGRVGGRFELGPVSDARSALPVAIGRDAPVFASSAGARPLLDPCISRRQVTVQWSPERRSFFVRQETDSRRSVRLLDLTGRDLGAPPAEVPPRSLIAIGDRVLLLLAVRPGGPPQESLGLVGQSDEMSALRNRLSAIAGIPDTVLVRGETGTGKELIARAIHLRSDRRQRPFLAINCAALPEALIESELFGHVKGAFSGATAKRTGMFSAAAGGTLLLDEIGEIPLSVQAKLLRALELRCIRPVGGQTEEPVDVRVIAATNRDLAEEVRAGRFRADLFSRIEAPSLLVPALAQRREDVPLLFAHFLRQRSVEQARAAGCSVEQTPFAPLWREADVYPPLVSLEQVLWMLSHDWPRNVRELDKLTAEVTVALLLGSPPPIPVVRALSTPAPERDAGAKPRPARAEVERLLEENNFNQADVARALDVPYATLDRWLREFGIVRPRDLSLSDIEDAWQQSGGDMVRVAQRLRVSMRGLKARMTELGLGVP